MHKTLRICYYVLIGRLRRQMKSVVKPQQKLPVVNPKIVAVAEGD